MFTRHRVSFTGVCMLLMTLTAIAVGSADNDTVPRCADLLMGQYRCDSPAIDPATQQARGCHEDSRTVLTPCRPAPQITCTPAPGHDVAHTYNGSEVGFRRDIPCKWTNGYSFETSLLLSIFLGMFGVDRFYLGYPAIGLLKFSTLGFFFLGQLIDVLLIATQAVGPADGSDYIINYFGAGLSKLYMDSDTVVKSVYS